MLPSSFEQTVNRKVDDAARLKLFRAAKISLLVILGVRSLIGVSTIVLSLSDPYLKDMRQGYLLAQAMIRGVDPYAPLPELSKRWMPEHPVANLNHPTPHPFAVGWLSLPLLLLSFERAAIVWFFLQLCCLALSCVLLLRILDLRWGKRRMAGLLLITIGSWPLMMELWWGQMGLLLLLLSLMAWQELRQGKDTIGGLLLGCMLLLKFVGWPIVLWLAMQRRWRAVWAAGLFWSGMHLLAIILHGWGMVRDYYLRVGPQVSAIYGVRELNLSMWTIGQRLFADSGYHIVTAPVWESPTLVKVFTMVPPLVVLALALKAAMLVKKFDTAFTLLLGVDIVLNPIAWLHYFILASPAIALLFRRTQMLHWPRQLTIGALVVVIALWPSHTIYLDLAKLFAGGSNGAGKFIVPAIPALLTMIPAVALFILLWLLLRSESIEDKQITQNRDLIGIVGVEA